MARCSFCRHNIEVGTGKMLILKDGRILHFCSMKCEKNQLKLGRVGRELKWTFGYQHDKKIAKKAAADAKASEKSK